MAHEHAKAELETEHKSSKMINLFRIDLGLRLLVVVTTATAVATTVTGNESKLISNPFAPFPLALDAKFTYSPALLYFVVANSAACLYTVFTILASVASISKRAPSTKLLFHLALFDALMVGIVASAAGAGASVAYIGLKGNSHVGWIQICNMYTKFCRHIGSSIIVSLVASVNLIFLVAISTYSLYSRIS